MKSLNMPSTDEITMRLVHYFVTKENYQPVIVNGLENEIWLENIESKYAVIRISNNYIHNNEQLDFDMFKAKTLIKQIKKKTFSLHCRALNILLNVGENVRLETKDKQMEVCTITDVSELNKDSSITKTFPELKEDSVIAEDEMDFFINITNDINQKTEEKNRIFEQIFKKKSVIVTYALIILNVMIYLLSVVGLLNINVFAMNIMAVKAGEWWRILTAGFFHNGILHLFCNMYSLYIIGSQLEQVLGKKRFTIIYFISLITSSLLSGVIGGASVVSVGASGAIFGLMGAILYFGYHYRLYLGSIVMSQVVPVILINLFIGFALPYVDNFGHIGGLVGGLFSGMMVGVPGKKNKNDTINGCIVTILLIAFLLGMLFIR